MQFKSKCVPRLLPPRHEHECRRPRRRSVCRMLHRRGSCCVVNAVAPFSLPHLPSIHRSLLCVRCLHPVQLRPSQSQLNSTLQAGFSEPNWPLTLIVHCIHCPRWLAVRIRSVSEDGPFVPRASYPTISRPGHRMDAMPSTECRRCDALDEAIR